MTGEEPIRLLVVTPRFAPDRGGVETHVEEVGRRLVSDHGVSVTILTTDRLGLLPSAEVADGMRILRVPARPRQADLYWAPGIERVVRRSGADLVHVQGYHTFVPPFAIMGALRARLPYVLTLHSGGHSSPLRRRIRPIQVALLRPLLRRAACLIAVSPFEADLFAAAGLARDRITTIPNGTDFPLGSDPGPIDRDPGLVLSIGRLERYKGHHHLIEALPLVRAAVPEARLMVVGSGPEEARLRALARDRQVEEQVTVGGLPRPELPALLRRASVVGLLSDYESHGMAAHEALALGARLVVTDATALGELSGRPGVVAIPLDAPTEVVAEAVIQQLAAGPMQGSTMTLPNWDQCASSLAALYAEIVRRPRSARTR